MKSDLPKVLHLLGGKPMLSYPITLARRVNSHRIIVVVGHQSHLVRESFPDPDLLFVEQGEPLGTGHAVFCAFSHLQNVAGLALILCGDVPLLRSSTVKAMMDYHRREKSIVTVMTTALLHPGSYGRVIRDEAGRVKKIVEAKDAAPRELGINEINTGIYCADLSFLSFAVTKIKNTNAQGEYYLTDIMAIAYERGLQTAAFFVDDPCEVMGINTPEELKKAETFLARGNICLKSAL